MAEKVAQLQDAPVPKRNKLPSEVFESQVMFSIVLAIAVMGFFTPKSRKLNEPLKREVARMATKAETLKAASDAAAKVIATPAPVVTKTFEVKTNPHASYDTSHQQPKPQPKAGILDAINDNSVILDATTIKPHLLKLGLTLKDHTAVEIVEAFKRKAVQCNPEMFERNDPAREENEKEFISVRDSFRLLIKYKEALRRQKVPNETISKE